MSNEIVIAKDLKTLAQSDYVQERFTDVLGKRAQGFIASMLSVASSNDLLAKAEPKSVLNAAMTAATLDLPINQNLGFAYILPYRQKDGTYVAQFQMGYKGFIQLAQRSGQFITINCTDVKEGELTGTNRLTGEMKFEWKDNRDELKTVGYVAYMKLVNGFEKSLYMTVKELEAHGLKYSQTAKRGYGLWKDDFDAMASKTVIKLLLSKYAPLTTAMQTAQLADQAVVKDENDYIYPDNEQVTPEDVAAEKERERIVKHINESKTLQELQLCVDHITDAETLEMYDRKKEELAKAPKGEVTEPK